ncbi:MAG TPA: FHA domain-containing protein, partial [Blastocatellia bacterium]|nr:FHA domain-containing protein [Blastocatellia bacterium]
MPVSFTYLVGPNKGRRGTFTAEQITVGRAPDNTLSFDGNERRVSSHHAEITRRGEHYLLRDLGSTNGTMINGRRVIASELRDEDMVEFGAGGPLLRFAIIKEETRSDKTEASLSAPAYLRSSAISRLLGRSSRTGAGNLRLIVALLAALAIGAVAGVLLSTRAGISDRGQMSFSEVAQRNSPAVVFIRSEFELVDETDRVISRQSRTGSGFVVTDTGLIVTNRHLIRDWEYNEPQPGAVGRTTRIEIVFPGQPRENALPAEVFRLSDSKEIDLAVLKIAPFENMARVLGINNSIESINQGDEVAVIGYPLGMDLMQLTHNDRIENSLSTGVVSRVNQDLIQVQLRAYRGA